MSDKISINGVESESLSVAAEKIAWDLLKAAGIYPDNFGLTIYMSDGRLSWDYDRSVSIPKDQAQLLKDVVDLVCDSFNR